jgi:hypothetical protein
LGGSGVSPVLSQAEACGYIFIVPDLSMSAKTLPDTWLRPYLFLEEALGEKAFGSENEYGTNNSLTCTVQKQIAST